MGQGIISPSAGPINSSMAGESVAAPVYFGGSDWNPAIISGLSSQEYLLGSASIRPIFAPVDDPGPFDPRLVSRDDPLGDLAE